MSKNRKSKSYCIKIFGYKFFYQNCCVPGNLRWLEDNTVSCNTEKKKVINRLEKCAVTFTHMVQQILLNLWKERSYCYKLQKLLTNKSLLNPTELRKAKIVSYSGLPECNRVKIKHRCLKFGPSNASKKSKIQKQYTCIDDTIYQWS